MRSEGADARLTTLYQRHYDEVLAYCARRIERTDADDVAADVFAVAWRRIDEITPDLARAWLFGIARGVLANRWRTYRRRAGLVGRVSGLAPLARDLPDDLAVRRAEDQEVLDVLQSMKGADREVLMLTFWEELTTPEIAHALGISESAVKQRRRRAEKRLAKALRPIERQSMSPRAADERGGC